MAAAGGAGEGFKVDTFMQLIESFVDHFHCCANA